ncbi:MAG: YicC family protein [Oscillospiraceae bacterium]|nr:YicC family protein [Oscillospiraceae bacterium]MBR7084928.1 YicC family protein [Oscillospiraceae bacterium]
MLKSMTGYGRAQNQIDGRDILVEIKSVNSRFLEQNVRISRNYTYLEEELKSLVKSKVSRGKTEISVTITLTEGKQADIKVNEEIVRGYLDAMKEYNLSTKEEKYHLSDDYDNTYSAIVSMKWANMLHLPDIFRVEKIQDDEEEIKKDVLKVAQQALNAFVQMRETEGEKLAEDILRRADYIFNLVSRIEEQAPALTEKYRERLFAKISEILQSTSIDEQRILTEAAIFSEKTAVDEETVRLKSHISQLKMLLKQNESVGRKLDFLVQEMNREVNTIGSKIQDVNITAIVVDMKSEIEKIREQIQNIE